MASHHQKRCLLVSALLAIGLLLFLINMQPKYPDNNNLLMQLPPCIKRQATPRVKKYVFLDLGSNDGEFLDRFFSHAENNKTTSNSSLVGYGTRSLASHWEIHSFEPNPHFKDILLAKKAQLEATNKHQVHVHIEEAVWVESKLMTFYLDVLHANKSSKLYGIASSLLKEHPHVYIDETRQNPIRVQAIDLAAFLSENFLPEDEVVARFDIEGAEYEILMHLMATNTLRLIDKMSIEFHGLVSAKKYPNAETWLLQALGSYYNIDIIEGRGIND